MRSSPLVKLEQLQLLEIDANPLVPAQCATLEALRRQVKGHLQASGCR